MHSLPILSAVFLLACPMPSPVAATPPSRQQAPQQGMTVGEFVDRWAELKPRLNDQATRGQAVTDAEAFLHVLGDAGKRYKDQLEADKAAGRPPRACPEKGSKDTFQVDDFVAALASRPRDMPLDQAFFDFMDERHPCS